MRIYIPTFGRFRQPTANALSEAKIPFTFVFSRCDKSDFTAMCEIYDQCASSVIAEVPTISAKRQWILEHSIGPKIVMLDDDLTFYARRRTGNFTKSTTADVRRMFKWIDKALDKHAHCGIVDKFMSQATPRGTQLSKRYNNVLGYNLQLFPRPRPKFRITVSEEHDVHLQLSAAGLPPVVSNEFSKNTSYYSEGGCSKERTARSELAGHRAFARHWPGIVSLVDSRTSLSGKSVKVKWRQSVRVRK